MLLSSFIFLFIILFKSTCSVTYSCDRNVSCGCSTNSASVSRIVGGENAGINTWGWAVSLSIDNRWLCAGSLLSSTWILTAAHCVEDMQPSQVLVSAATNKLLGWKQWKYATSVIVHPEYDSATIVNDIALIEVSPPFDMTDPGIAKVCLPMPTNEDYPPINSIVVAVGWGLTAENGNVSTTLEQVTLQRIPYESDQCFGLLANESSEFCAGVPYNGKGVCQGDSGGGLIMFTESHQWVVVGIVSYGYGCAHADYANVFTRVVYYLDWIYSMNVTDAITVGNTINTTTMANNISHMTNVGFSYYRQMNIAFILFHIIAKIIL